MKKKISLLLANIIGLSIFSTTCFAKIGDRIGYAKYTDIACYINHYPITSYNVKDRTAVVAEDLRNYGFDVIWNGSSRSLNISRSNAKTIAPYGKVYKNSSKMGQDAVAYLETDIKTYANGKEITSYNIGGNTVIFLEDLSDFGNVIWVPEVRALKMWIDNLPKISYVPLEEEPSEQDYESNYLSNVQTVSISPFGQLKQELISKGKYSDGAYGIFSLVSGGGNGVFYNCDNDTISLVSTSDSGFSVSLLLTNNSDSFDLSTIGLTIDSPIFGIPKIYVTDSQLWANNIYYLTGAYNDTAMKLYSESVRLALVGASLTLLNNGISVTVQDLGFINYKK